MNQATDDQSIYAVPLWRRLLAANRGRWLGMAVSLAFTCALLMPDPGPMPAMRFLAFDTYQTKFPRERKSADAVIVAIDEKSLARVGQWPWPRDVVAQLVTKIAARNPAAIGVDILFTEPDRLSPDRLAAEFRTRDPLVAGRLEKMQPFDAVLAAALARTPVVLGVAGVPEQSSGGYARTPAKLAGPDIALKRYAGELHSMPALDKAAAGRGLLNATPDRGIVHRVELAAVAGTDPQPLFGLTIETLRVAAGEPLFTLVSGLQGLNAIALGDVRIPVQPDGSFWVHYSQHDPDRFISAVDVLDGTDDASKIEKSIVLVGVTGLGLVDRVATPLGKDMVGIEVHAQVLENIFERSMLARPAWMRILEAALFALIAAIVIFSVPRMPPKRSPVIPLACGALLAAGGLAGYLGTRVLFDPLTPIWGMNIVYGLMVSATLAAIDMERRDLAKRLAIEREAAARVAGELNAANRIQTRMLPDPAVVLANEKRIEIFSHMRPAREVGGDLYDFFLLADNRIFLLAGDVAGKGLPAAMFMTVSKALAKSSTLRQASGLASLMTVINEEISRDNPEELFVTLIALIVDLESGEIEYCNAGHEPPLLVRADGRIDVLDDGGGPPICVLPDFPYETATTRYERGDVLVLMSDGITEAHDSSGGLYGRERVNVLMQSASLRTQDVAAIGQTILDDVVRFEAGAETADDQTLLVARWRGPA